MYKRIVAGIVGPKSANNFFDFLDTNKILSAEELLTGEFSKTREKLLDYSTPEFAVINDSIFPFLEKVRQ